jgi:DNA-binding NarL/FixJ family response regulator
MLVLDSKSLSPAAATVATAASREARSALDDELRVLLVDDHPAICTGLRELLAAQPDVVVVGAVASAQDAMTVAEREPVDVVVADYQLGSHSGLWLSRKLKELTPAPAVVIYSAYSGGALAAACVVAQADALVSKAAAPAELCQTIRAVARGARRLPVVPSTLTDTLRRTLDPKDQAIFGLLLSGLECPEVATTLRISRAEVDARMWRMMHALEGLRASTRPLHATRPMPWRRRRR